MQGDYWYLLRSMYTDATTTKCSDRPEGISQIDCANVKWYVWETLLQNKYFSEGTCGRGGLENVSILHLLSAHIVDWLYRLAWLACSLHPKCSRARIGPTHLIACAVASCSQWNSQSYEHNQQSSVSELPHSLSSAGTVAINRSGIELN